MLSRLAFAVIGLLLTCFVVYTTFRAPTVEKQDALNLLSAQPLDEEVVHILHTSAPPPTPTTPTSTPHQDDQTIYRVQNETVGFQEIYMISLPFRSDKQDSFTMQAALSGMKFIQIDGVDGNQVPEKALPFTMDQSPNAVGCWRAHMDVIKKIVHDDVATALIFEDDADWDVSFKQQLVQFARGSRYILKTPEDEEPFSPYGDDWDMLWIGHCGTWVYPGDRYRYFVIPEDPTVEPPAYRLNVDAPDMSHWEGPDGDNSTRIVFNSEGGVCTAAYALSQKGARKALYHMSMQPYNSPIDWGFANLCKNKVYNFTCVSVFPQLVGVSRPMGNTSKWSDIGYGEDSERTVEPANSLHLVFSTRLNMGRLLEGSTRFDSQYPEDTEPVMHINEIGRAVGHIEELSPEDFPVETDPA